MNRAKSALGGAMGIILAGAIAGSLAACGGSGDTTNAGTTGSGAGGSATTGAGGAGATTGAGGGATTGAGGAAPVCMDASTYANDFDLVDDTLCVVASYTADVVLGYDMPADYTREPTWGRHGGPVTLTPTMGGVTIERWAVPAGATGALSKTTQSVALTIPDGAFVGAQAIDLPFFEWTALSWTPQYPDTKGEVLLVKGDALDVSYPVNGFYAGAGIAAAPGGRLVYSGLGVLGDANGNETGLYAADSCGSPGMSPRLVPDGDGSCGAPIAIAAWGDASGPIAADADGSVFAVDTSFDGTQELRGFAASTTARGAGPASGDVVVKMSGFGSALAALAPDAERPGLVAFQPNDGMTYAALDVVEQRFTIQNATIVTSDPVDAPKKLVHFATGGTAAHLFTDDVGRLWLGLAASDTSSRFYVLARK